MAQHLPFSEFERFPETPVELVAFDPAIITKAKRASEELVAFLDQWNKEPYFFGSAALGLMGKDEVELAVFALPEEMDDIKNALAKKYGSAVSNSNNRFRFEYEVEGTEIEIILCDESERMLTVAKTEYLRDHPEEKMRYEELKRAYAYSKREYLYRKNEFFADITDAIVGAGQETK